MSAALGILKRDLLALLRNPIALIVVGALLVLPGLYAWYCILANWDPYSNTAGMPVAVVNYDKGATNDLAGEVNIGEQVVEKLKENDSIDWRFYDSEEEALRDTQHAVVYATIVMPEDLSKNVVGIFEGSDKKPIIYYYPNEKYSAVATKVTDSATQTLIRSINQGFSSTVNKVILESSQKISDKVEDRADQGRQSASAELKEVQADLDKVIASLNDASDSIQGWRQAANGASAALRATATQLPSIEAMLDQGSNDISELRIKTDDFERDLSATVLSSAASVSNMSAQASTTLKQTVQDLKVIEEKLKALEESAGSDETLKESVRALESIVGIIEALVTKVDDSTAKIDAKVQDATASVSTATSEISGEVMPQLSSGANSLAVSFSRLSGAVRQFEPQVVGLLNVLAQTDEALVMAEESIADAKTTLSKISANLRGTVNDIGTIGSALEIDELSDLLDVDPDGLSEFISMPVQITTEKIYPVSNYGTAVAPFYTNLALWIGCFILVSLIKVEVTGFPEATARQRYFGRWLLFVVLSLLQSQVICGVDILLGIDCGNPALFMLAGAVCSFAYMNLIYALVKTFRNIGKTLCIFLLIMQVPGSSGMYPIEMMPGFFQAIHPSLPFTYGIDAMREALSGMYGLTALKDMGILLLMVPVSLLLGLGLRPLMANLLLLFDEEMNKTGFFASEEYVAGMESERFRGMVRALAAHESYADDIEEGAWRFNRTYPRWRKIGTVATFVVPFAFLVIMLPFNVGFDLSTDTKLTALIVMLVLLLVVLFGLIVLEYLHRTIAEETRLLGESLIDDELMADLASFRSAGAADVEDSSPFVPALDSLQADAALPRRGVIRDIFKTDVRLGFQSVIGVVVIMLLVITPSMYAWFNIAGSWNPYGNTGNLKVAVVNDDAGYKGELIPVTINVGDTVISQLRGNESFDWVFVDADEAIEGVEGGKYYAAIRIPSDFSANLMTYLTVEDASYPNVVYYTNEKENPIAPIITQKGADSIQESIRVSFTERVDAVVLGVAYDVLNYISNPRLSSYVTKMSKHLDDALGDTKNAAREIRSLGALMKTISGIVDTTGTTIEGIKAAAASARYAVDDAKVGVTGASSAFERAASIVRGILGGHAIDIDTIEGYIDVALDLLESGSKDVPDRIQVAIDMVKAMKDSHPDVPAAKFDALIASLEDAKAHAEKVPGNIANARTTTASLIQDANAEIAETKAYFENNVMPAIDDLRSTLSSVATSTSEIVDGLEVSVNGLGDSTEGLSNQLTSQSAGLDKVGDKLESSATKIEATKKRVSEALESGDVEKIKSVILGGDPEAMAKSLALPIQQERVPMYSVANFGSSMAPFYTVLSLWVGALVMISTMRVHVVEERVEELRRRYAKVCPRHEFFGRYGIFGLIGLLQSSLVLLGDLLFLHIQCVNPVAFFLGGIFIGQVFCLLVYTLSELFGDVGKALCVILLIMQVAASGGTFPVQMLDKLLIGIVPFLPFYHAMTMLQECVAGVYWPTFLENAGVLLVFLGIALIAGVPLRKPFRKVNDFFEHQLERTGYM